MEKKSTCEELEWKFKGLADEVARCKTSENSLRESIKVLRKERDFFQEAISAVCQPLYAIEAKNYKIIMANPTALNLYGDFTDKPFCYSWTQGRSTPCSVEGHPCPLEVVRNKKNQLF
jgi:hypothetical protein